MLVLPMAPGQPRPGASSLSPGMLCPRAVVSLARFLVVSLLGHFVENNMEKVVFVSFSQIKSWKYFWRLWPPCYRQLRDTSNPRGGKLKENYFVWLLLWLVCSTCFTAFHTPSFPLTEQSVSFRCSARSFVVWVLWWVEEKKGDI